MTMRYWLMKSEPDCFSISDLRKSPGRASMWDGVRNYQVRNMLRDDFKKGDLALFYHSSCPEPGIVGVMEVMCPGYPDPTAFMPGHEHHDPKSLPDQPRWYTVDVKYKREFELVSLDEIRRHPPLEEMLILRRGNRLSITPVTPPEWEYILALRS
jgi:predicted RNA-binding protein with PUA-like domain